MYGENDQNLEITLEEIKTFRKEMLLMHGVLASDMVEGRSLLKEVADLFIEKGLDKVWIDKKLASLIESEVEEDKEALIAYLLEEIDDILYCKPEEKTFEKKVQILIGSTGVGKTSLIGKLGARYAYLLEQTYRVAFHNHDLYKLGAIEQLQHYSDVMEIPLLELKEFIQSDEYDVLLVDTAGTRGESVASLAELIEFFEVNSDYQIELTLVLSATAKSRDMSYLMERFSSFSIDNVIFTKLDETEDRSDIIKFSLDHQIPISYLSVGQEIPEDLIVANNEYILEKFIIEDKNT